MSTAEADPTRMQYFNPTVAGAFEGLEYLASAVVPVCVIEVASATRLIHGTALRVMRTLAKVPTTKAQPRRTRPFAKRLILTNETPPTHYNHS